MPCKTSLLAFVVSLSNNHNHLWECPGAGWAHCLCPVGGFDTPHSLYFTIPPSITTHNSRMHSSSSSRVWERPAGRCTASAGVPAWQARWLMVHLKGRQQALLWRCGLGGKQPLAQRARLGLRHAWVGRCKWPISCSPASVLHKVSDRGITIRRQHLPSKFLCCCKHSP